jgi:hypothetical protein
MVETIYLGTSHVVFFSSLRRKNLALVQSSSYPHGRKNKRCLDCCFMALFTVIRSRALLLIRSVARSSGLHKMILGSVELMRTCAEAKL